MTKLAYDRSAREFDSFGRLHVELTPISKANICPYYGHEIPKAKELGLVGDRVYQMFRHPQELKNGAETSNNMQMLELHRGVSADDPGKQVVIGTTGTDARFDSPYLMNSLSIWDQEAIDLIQSNQKKQLSCSYSYDADMTPGSHEGQSYDGVMRNIRFNHVALVKEGRAGADVMVADAMPLEFAKDNDFDEEEHPRDDDGKFTLGGGSSKPQSKAVVDAQKKLTSLSKTDLKTTNGRLESVTGTIFKGENTKTYGVKLGANAVSGATRYSTSAFNINYALRENEKQTPRDAEAVAHLDAAIDKSTTGRDIVTHRFAAMDKTKLTALVQAFKEGKKAEFSDPAYSSVSTDKNDIEVFSGYIPKKSATNITMEVLLPSGSKALFMDALHGKSYESELILPRNQKFQVLSITDQGGIAHLQVLAVKSAVKASDEKFNHGVVRMKITPKAQIARGALAVYLKPLLAADAAIDLKAVVLGPSTNKPWDGDLLKVAERLKIACDGKLIEGASLAPDALKLAFDAASDEMSDEDDADDEDPEEVRKRAAKEAEDKIAAKDKRAKDRKAAKDKAAKDVAKAAADADKDDDKDAKADDEDKEDDDDDKKDKFMSKDAMDEQIKIAVTQARDAMRADQKALREAEEIVKPVLGALAMDSAADVYKVLFKDQEVDIKGLPEVAYPALARQVVRAATATKGTRSTRMAHDSAIAKGFATRFAGAAAIRHI